MFQNPKSSVLQQLQLHDDFPGGVESFELCAKFCYDITIILSAYNIVSIRCAAEYLQMTEHVEKGNLMHKLDVFFISCILNGWRDTIVTLQATKEFPTWSEDVGITGRCIEAIASKVLANPSKISLCRSYSRRVRDDVSCNGSDISHRNKPKGWWGEDLADIGIDLYWRTMVAIKSGGKVSSKIIGDALRIYASRWLPNVSKEIDSHSDSDSDSDSDLTAKHRMLLESIIGLLPAEKGAVSCSFLTKLLKASNVLKACSSSRTELARRVGLQLEEATVNDLLVPCLASRDGPVYDVDVVVTILEEFMLQGQKSPQTSPPRDLERRRSRSAEDVGFLEFQERRRSSSASHSAKLKVAKLVDGYLQVIAKDRNLALSKFIGVAEVIPEFARVEHDDLYKAIDIYLKVHPELNKSERKRLCRILDCKKLSMEACIHAAQNEMLPLRVVVQVLFFEQALLAGNKVSSKPKASFTTNSTMAPEDQWSVSGQKSQKSNLSTLKMKLAEDIEDLDDNNFRGGIEKSSKVKSLSVIPSRSKRIFSKFWAISRNASEKN
ncbi:hypothetical protein DH2020_049660 [Rehmannia glutinosa]|uniref:NPH3 domain-containing protein n=1 Tax=Rehmannia glutinosa TaxID=99300 RepID=A0ABR0U236_REHGL